MAGRLFRIFCCLITPGTAFFAFSVAWSLDPALALGALFDERGASCSWTLPVMFLFALYQAGLRAPGGWRAKVLTGKGIKK